MVSQHVWRESKIYTKVRGRILTRDPFLNLAFIFIRLFMHLFILLLMFPIIHNKNNKELATLLTRLKDVWDMDTSRYTTGFYHLCYKRYCRVAFQINLKPFHYDSFEMGIKETYWIEWHGSSLSSH